MLTSALDGIYRYSWDISGLFSSNSGTHLTIEYHDATAVALSDILVTSKTRVDVAGGGGGNVHINGIWTPKQKKKLLDDIKELKKDIKDSKESILFLLQRILAKETLRKEDLDFIRSIQKENGDMWQEFLKVMKLQENSTSKELIEKLEEYYKTENEALEEVKERLKNLTEKLTPKKTTDWDSDNEDD